MGIAFNAERRLLSADEVGQVERSHYPLLETLPRDELVELARWLRARHGRARDLLRDRRRSRRGKDAARTAPEDATADRGLSAKKQIFAAGLKRANARLAVLAAEARREANLGKLRAALARRQAAAQTHPGAAPSARPGMQALPGRKVRPTIRPGRIGSTSQAGKAAQARRDARG